MIPQYDGVCYQACKVLWHLDIFRRSFRELSGHACMADSCIFCALKELFAQFQYSHESALPPDALRRALAETFFNQQRFQLGFMDDAAECFENILLRIHFHIANNESEDMCNAVHCIPHQKFAMTLVEQGVCHACGATSEPLPFTQMVHYVTSSTLCAQAKMSRETGDRSFLHDFGKLLRKAGGMGEIRDCPSACGAKIQIQRTLMNHPEIMSIGIVWDSERPTLDHIMDVFQAIGSIIHLRDVFHTVVDDRWAASAEHQLVGVVTYYGKHYSTFFFHTKLRVWIYFDDATVREVGPRWEQVVDKCRRGHFQPLLLLYANPYGNPVMTESAPKTVVYSRASHMGTQYPVCRSMEMVQGSRSAFVSPLRRALTPNPERQHDSGSEVIPRRAITPNPEVYYRHELQGNHPNCQPEKTGHYYTSANGVVENVGMLLINSRMVGRPAYPVPASKPIHDYGHGGSGSSNGSNHQEAGMNSIYNVELLQQLLQNKCCNSNGQMQNVRGGGGGGLFDGGSPLRTNGYFNNCDVVDGDKSVAPRRPFVQNGDIGVPPSKDAANNIYISRKAVENVLNYQKSQRHRSNSENNDSAAGSRNSNSSLDSFENPFRMRSHYNVALLSNETQRSTAAETVDAIGIVDGKINNVPRCRDSGNWSGDRNSSSSTGSNSVENPYFSVAGIKRVVSTNGFQHGSPVKGQLENGGHRATYDAGYDSFSLSSNDSFPMSHVKHHNQPQLAQILENPNRQPVNGINAMPARLIKNRAELADECHMLSLEADTFLEKSLESEKLGDLEGAISFCNSAAAKARAAMDAPYSNPQILVFARMKHNTCVMRARTLHRRQLVRKDSISSHSSSTGTDMDSPHKPDGGGHHSRQSSRDSTRSRSSGNHSRQSSRDGGGGNHSRQGSKDSTLNGSRDASSSSDKKRIELYGTLPKRNSAKKTEKTAADASFQFINGMSSDLRPLKPKPVAIPIVRDTRIPRRISFRTATQPHLEAMNSNLSTFNFDSCKKSAHPPPAVPIVDRSDVESTVDARQKSTLHRTNSIPAKFVSKFNHSSMDSISPASVVQADSSGSMNKVGKKQHKIRRKLLMGGLIRRKNRSMPDLREGQNNTSSSSSLPLELNPKCYDDFSLQGARLPSSADMLDSRRKASNLSCQDIYYASQNQNHQQHHHSSHGKIPPPPPVRTTSQLTSRSQSHGSLFSTTQERRKTAFGFPCPVVPHSSNAQPLKRPTVPVPPPSQSNEVTIQADIHHERTPSDSIRPVSLARTMSMRGLSSNQNQQRPLIVPRNETNFCISSTSQLPSVQIQSPHPDQLDVTDGRLNDNNRDASISSAGSGLLEQLLSKRQQMLDNPSKVVQETHDAKVQLPKSEGWLQELQAKQQLMLGKKPVGPPTRLTTTNAETNGLPTGLQVPCGMASLDHMSQVSNHSISKQNNGLQSKSRAPTPSLIPTNDVCNSDSSNYRPKSVRDLANKFEKILVTPPSAASSDPQDKNGRRNESPSSEGLVETTTTTSIIPQQQRFDVPELQSQGFHQDSSSRHGQLRHASLETRDSPLFDQRHQRHQEQCQQYNSNFVDTPLVVPATSSANRNSHLVSPSISSCQQQIALIDVISRMQQPVSDAAGVRSSSGSMPPPYPGPYSQVPAPLVGTRRNGLPVPPTKLPVGVETVKQATAGGHGDRTFQRKRGKKSVTFSDQIVLVACAEDNNNNNEGFSLLNPLLEKVLHKSITTTNVLNHQEKQSSASNSSSTYYQLDNGNVEPAYRQQTSDRGPRSMAENSFDFPSSHSGLPPRSSTVNFSSTCHGLSNGNGVSTPEVPCYLCRKKTVLPPVVYCVDCEFYMSRFKPKN